MRRPLNARAVVMAMAMTGAVLGVLTAPSPMLGALTVESANSSSAEQLFVLSELLANPTIIHPDIARQVAVDLRGLGSLPADLSAARIAGADAVAAGHSRRARQSQLIVLQRDKQAEKVVAVAEVEAADEALALANSDLAAFATSTFLGSAALNLESFSTETGPSPIPTLAEDAEAVLVGAQRASVQRLAAARGESDRIANELEEVDVELAQVIADIERADLARDEAKAEVARLEPAFEAALLTAPVVGADFPVVVLDAYYRAALRTAEDKPWCEVRWDQLAGIGKVESRHGTFGGNTVGSDGRTDGEILGPVLDGTRFASIPDTDGGKYDLDPIWDRAVGPMQFIPGSWSRFGGDGDGDGTIDPHNMYDAALAAANHLCGSTGGLSDDANYQRALLGYNRSAPYGVTVMDFASQYRSIVGLAPRSNSVADPVSVVSVAAVRIPVVD